MSRDRFARQALGVLHHKIKDVSLQATALTQSRVLLVGAGGIGCELLKNLVLTGFGEVHIIDLDTIDLSNLNRQFLFGHEHIKRSKALVSRRRALLTQVAKETASKFNPNVTIEAHHANIKDSSFDIDFFSSFAVVFNALDNLEARRHVNRMCLAADVPLIESGTTGFNGQVQVIKRGLTECYDCNPKETPKTFPVCTIRSTPSQPIHCIVWAKSYLFAEIFGTSEDDAPDMDTTQNSENAEEIENLRAEAQALKRIRESMGSKDFAQKVFEKVFTDDVVRLRSMEDMWRSRKKPNPLDFDKLQSEYSQFDAASKMHATWSLSENFSVFSDSLVRLSNRLEKLRAETEAGTPAAVLSFDKDDQDSLDFVASSANLRSYIFGIEPKSEFDIKRKYESYHANAEMAGNIIPAIATTNATTAALCVLQSIHVLRGTYQRARMVFLVKSLDRVMSSELLAAPNPHCSICGVAHARISVNLEKATLRDVVEILLRGQLAYGEELSVSIDGAGTIYDPDFEDNLDKLLTDLGIRAGSFMTVMDEDEVEPRVNLVLAVQEQNSTNTNGSGDSDTKAINLLGTYEIKRKPPRPVEQAIQQNGNGNHANGAATTVNGHAEGTGEKRKRQSENGDLDAHLSKRGKVVEEAPPVPNGTTLPSLEKSNGHDHGGAIMLDDDGQGEGAIVIDDD